MMTTKTETQPWNTEDRNAFRELMNKYDASRQRWIETVGSEAGFSEWFTKQVVGNR